MIDLPILTWITRPIVWVSRFAWSKLRIKDGSFVSLGCIGDTKESQPEFLYLGLQETDITCLVRLYLSVKNEGRAPIRNLSVKVELPRNLTADVRMERANPSGSDAFYSTKIGRRRVVLNFETSLRIDEGALFPILLIIRPDDWIEARTGGPKKRKGDLVLTDYMLATPVRVAALRMKVSAQADNIRSCYREWDVWLTPAESLDHLENHITSLAAIQQIWSIGSRAFIFPFRGFSIFLPPWRSRYQQGALVHLDSNECAQATEFGRLFDISLSEEFLPIQIYRRLAVNPGEGGIEFRNWVRSIKQAKPEYYE